MTKDDYIKAANVLRTLAPFDTNSHEWVAWCHAVEAFASIFQRDNPRFSRLSFCGACLPAGRDNPTTWPK